MSLNRLVLALNAAYEPVNVITAKRAFILLAKGAAVTEHVSDAFVRTGSMVLPIPSVIRFIRYRKLHRPSGTVTRKHILLRDRFTCQYCGSVFGNQTSALTLDHVLPRSRGGQNTWENLVSSCKPCNGRKNDRTPIEAGMKLLHKPAKIGLHAKHRLMAGPQIDPAWEQYLYV